MLLLNSNVRAALLIPHSVSHAYLYKRECIDTDTENAHTDVLHRNDHNSVHFSSVACIYHHSSYSMHKAIEIVNVFKVLSFREATISACNVFNDKLILRQTCVARYLYVYVSACVILSLSIYLNKKQKQASKQTKMNYLKSQVEIMGLPTVRLLKNSIIIKFISFVPLIILWGDRNLCLYHFLFSTNIDLVMLSMSSLNFFNLLYGWWSARIRIQIFLWHMKPHFANKLYFRFRLLPMPTFRFSKLVKKATKNRWWYALAIFIYWKIHQIIERIFLLYAHGFF